MKIDCFQIFDLASILICKPESSSEFSRKFRLTDVSSDSKRLSKQSHNGTLPISYLLQINWSLEDYVSCFVICEACSPPLHYST
jgi:hypothetical protein